ncbi:hypothetical protein BVRB_5g101870 [Beta vulgaris subsp. vulgaris]|nr:hypothetical protein BVRB_5g101870 [Beta vulgaris subsp. vulgaris]
MMQPLSPDNDHPMLQARRRLTKLLLSVTVQGSAGKVQVIMSMKNTVEDLIKAVLEVYEKEKRRPLLSENHPSCFELHYSPFCLESLKVEEKLINLGSRNFFLCHKPVSTYHGGTCLNKIDKSQFPLVRLMDFFQQIMRSLYHIVTKA